MAHLGSSTSSSNSNTPKRKKMDNSAGEMVEGYVYNISPFKGQRMNYFDGKIMTEDGVSKTIVCFSSQKRNELRILAENKTGVHLEGVRKEIDNTGKAKYLIHDKSLIKPVELKFEADISTEPLLNLSQIHAALLDKHYSICGKLIKIEEKEKTNYRDMECQRVYLANEESSVEVMLWGKQCNTLTLDISYKLSAVKVRMYGENKYMTTSPNTEIIECTEIFVGDRVISQIVTSNRDPNKRGKFVSVKETFSFLSCPTCSKAITIDDTMEEVILCKHCSNSTLKELCEDSGCVILNFQDDVDKSIVQLTLYKEQLAVVMESKLGNNEIVPSVKELFESTKTCTLYFLKLGTVSVTYNMDKMKITKITV